jgi:tetratricopeptide (TPR) repeat protein
MTRFHSHFAIFFFLVFCCASLGLGDLTYAADQSSQNGESVSRPAKRKIRISRRGRGSNAELSLPQIRSAIKKDSDKNANLFYRAGFLEEQQGNLYQALRDYNDSVKKNTRVADANYRLGVVWEKLGEMYDLRSRDKGIVINAKQRQRAIEAYQSAVLGRPDFADAYYRLSLVYLLGDDMREANEAYQKLHRLEPETDRTRQLLLMIYKHHQQQSRQR